MVNRWEIDFLNKDYFNNDFVIMHPRNNVRPGIDLPIFRPENEPLNIPLLLLTSPPRTLMSFGINKGIVRCPTPHMLCLVKSTL
jgi:hypothetical protein